MALIKMLGVELLPKKLMVDESGIELKDYKCFVLMVNLL